MEPRGAGSETAPPQPAGPAAGHAAADAGAQGRTAPPPVLSTIDWHVRFSGQHVLKGVTLDLRAQRITAIVGPSGCGKSTLLRSLNRMNDGIPNLATQGRILFDGADIHAPGVDAAVLRRRIGMVFQRPVVFPMSIFDNVAYGARIHRLERTRSALSDRVQRCLADAGLWEEVQGRLRRPAGALSGGQQQRLCIARALAVDPEVILLDEPTSALDPVATARVEDTLLRLAARFTIVIVTHNLQQAARISDEAAFFLDGALVECGPTETVFHRPRDRRTEDYLTGRFG